MTHTLLPAIWLIILIAGLPQLCETVYTPSLPDIAQALQTSETMVEYTLTIYLFAFALGVLFWSKISDRIGRKPCVIAGLLIFIIGCAACYFSTSIEMLMLSRFIQAFGGSISSVLGQAICRDAFHGPALSKAYSFTTSAMAIFPAIGPVIGGFIADQIGWSNIFLFLICLATILTILVFAKLPETHLKNSRQHVSIARTALELATDKKVVALGLIVSACNGIIFSYFAEGSFYLIKGLFLSPSEYGLSFIPIALPTIMGGTLCKKLLKLHTPARIIEYGLWTIPISAATFSSFCLINHFILQLSNKAMIAITIICQMAITLGSQMATSNALALALVDYKHAIGTASSLFGFFYYCMISLFTLGMGFLHNGTLLAMPLYFCLIATFAIIIKRTMLGRN